MKFKNKYTGVILKPKDEFVIEQLKNNASYELVVEKVEEKKEIKLKKAVKPSK